MPTIGLEYNPKENNYYVLKIKDCDIEYTKSFFKKFGEIDIVGNNVYVYISLGKYTYNELKNIVENYK